MPLACSQHPSIMPASFLHALPGLVGAWGEIWHGGALEMSAFDRLAVLAGRAARNCAKGQAAIRRSERAGGGPPPARSAQRLQARRWATIDMRTASPSPPTPERNNPPPTPERNTQSLHHSYPRTISVAWFHNLCHHREAARAA